MSMLVSTTVSIRVDWNTNNGPIMPPTPTPPPPPPQRPYAEPAQVWEDQSNDIPNPNPYKYVNWHSISFICTTLFDHLFYADMCHHRHLDPDTIRTMTSKPMESQTEMKSATVDTIKTIRRNKIMTAAFSLTFHRISIKRHRRPSNNTTSKSISTIYWIKMGTANRTTITI